MRTKTNRKTSINNWEKKLYILTVFSFAFMMFFKIFGGALIGNLNMRVEAAKYEINYQTKKNESLTMKVNELTSFDKIKDVVKEMGLGYNNDNIIIINQ
jgi:cell division protein FtsL